MITLNPLRKQPTVGELKKDYEKIYTEWDLISVSFYSLIIPSGLSVCYKG